MLCSPYSHTVVFTGSIQLYMYTYLYLNVLLCHLLQVSSILPPPHQRASPVPPWPLPSLQTDLLIVPARLQPHLPAALPRHGAGQVPTGEPLA